MSDFERHAIQRVIDKATALGVPVPAELSRYMNGHESTYAARTYAEQHPDADCPGCCWGWIMGDAERCTCWVPVYDVEQSAPIPPTCPEDLSARAEKCGDCAFRKGSPEWSEEWEREALLELAETGSPFWCHDGMRRPVRWTHPKLSVVIPGDESDYQPPIVRGIPYRADGRPGILCAGWTAIASKRATS